MKKGIAVISAISFCFRLIAFALFVFCFGYAALAQQNEDEDYDSLFKRMNEGTQVSRGSTSDMQLWAEHRFMLPMYSEDCEFAYRSSGIAPLEHRCGTEASIAAIKAFAEVSFAHSLEMQSDHAYTEVSLDEAYISYGRNTFLLSCGNQIFTWGVADSFNPTDWINPRDERNPFECGKMPVASMRVSLFVSDTLAFDCVFVPHKQRNRRFPDESDSVPEEMFSYVVSGFDTDAGTLEYSHYRQITYEKDRPDIRSSAAALRVRCLSSDFDTSFSFGYDRDQYFTPDLSLVRQSDMSGAQSGYMIETMTLKRSGLFRFGAEGKMIIDRFGLWSENCFTFNERFDGGSYRRRGSEFVSTEGVDTSYGSGDRGYANLQYNLRFIPDFDSSFYDDYRDGLPDSSMSGDAAYMERYYYRALVQSMGNRHSRYLHTLLAHNEYKIIENRLVIEADAGYQLPVEYNRDNSSRIGVIISGLKMTFTPEDALRLHFGAHHALPLRYCSNNHRLKIDRESEMSESYEKSYVYAGVDYRWRKKL